MPLRRPWAFERGTLWALDLNAAARADAVAQASTLPDVTFTEVTPDQTVLLARAMDASDPQVVRMRLAAGRRCFAAHLAGAIVAYGWVSLGSEQIGELERTMRMPPGEAYIWDCATLPAFRGRGLYTALLRHIVAALRGEGLRRLWIGASLDNTPSIRGFRAAGFRPVLRLVYVRVLNLRYNRLVGDATAPSALVAAAREALSASREGEPPVEVVSEQRAGAVRRADAEER